MTNYDYAAIAARLSQNKNLEHLLFRLHYREGRPVEVGANQTFMLSGADNAWVVYSGMVDVFAVPLQDGQVVGVRRHIFRGQAGQLLLGIDPDEHSTDVGFLVTGMPGTQVLKLDCSRFRDMAANLEYRDLIAAMLEAWAAGLLTGMTKEAIPKDYVLLEAGQETVPVAPQAAVPRRNILWVRPLGGNAQFMDHPELCWVDTDCYMPVLRHTWLRPVGQTRLQAIDTESFIQQDPTWSALEHFHRLALDGIVLNQMQEESAERERLQSKAESQDLLMENALASLASPLAVGEIAELAEIIGDEQLPLLGACRLVGSKLDIKIQPYPGMGKERVQKAMLMNIAQASRFRIRQVALRGEWWHTDSGPLLGFLGENERPVALLPVSTRQYELVDPVERSRTPVTSQMNARLASLAYTFYRPFPNRSLTAWDLVGFGLRDCKRDLFAVALAGVATGLLSLAPPLATKAIFGSIIPSEVSSPLLHIGMALILLALASGMFQIIRSLAVLRVQSKVEASIQAAIWDRILSLPASFFRDFSSGDLGVRAMGITRIRNFLSGHVMTTLLTSLFSLCNLVLLFVYSARLAWVALALALIAVLATALAGYLQVRYERALSDVRGRISGKVLQILVAVSKFRLTGAERRAFAIWAEGFTTQRKLAYRARTIANGLRVFNAGYPVLASLAIFAVIALSAGSGLPIEDFLAFNLASTQFLFAVLSLSAILVSTIGIVPIFERTKPILDTLPEVDEFKVDPGVLTGAIEVNHLSFRYIQNGPLVLQDIALHVSPGEFVALVGPSGSGKSTLLRLLLGFETPESGGVYYDGQDLSGLDLRAVRQQIGVVLQSAKLMSGDIYTNIVGASPYLTLNDAWEAARMAGLDEDIRDMPMGMHTVISEDGGNLSGGQRQRLLIARALVKKPRLLFFDEATSALDNQAQAIVSQSLEGLQITRLVIAHRLSTIASADRIFVFESGRIVQTGTYQELINRPGPFANLAKRQLI